MVRVPCTNTVCPNQYHYNKPCPKSTRIKVPCQNSACPNKYHYDKTCPLLKLRTPVVATGAKPKAKDTRVRVPCTNTACPNGYHFDKDCPHPRPSVSVPVPAPKKPAVLPAPSRPKLKLKPEHGQPLSPDIYVVANAIHTSADKCKTGSWLAWTQSRSKMPKNTHCMIAGCPGDAAIGGHVLIQDYTNTTYYFILPLCRTCNAHSGYLDYDWRKTRKCAPVACRWHESVPRDGNRTSDVKPGRRARFPR